MPSFLSKAEVGIGGDQETVKPWKGALAVRQLTACE